MENEVSHGAIKHKPGAPCKICARKTEKLVPETDETAQISPSDVSNVQQAAYDEVVNEMYNHLEVRRQNLALPVLTLNEINEIAQKFASKDVQKRGIL